MSDTVKVVPPDARVKLLAEGVASKVNPLMLSRTDNVPLIWVSALTSKN